MYHAHRCTYAIAGVRDPPRVQAWEGSHGGPAPSLTLWLCVQERDGEV